MNKYMLTTIIACVIVMISMPIIANSTDFSTTRHHSLGNINKTTQAGSGISSIKISTRSMENSRVLGTISGHVFDPNNNAIRDAVVTADTATVRTDAEGVYTLSIPAGTYIVACAAAGYIANVQENIEVQDEQTTTLDFVLNRSVIVKDGFETYADFATNFAPWVSIDVDQSITWGIENHTFPGSEEAGAFIVFNPTSVVPPITNWSIHGGTKVALCFDDVLPADFGTGPNNDWLISGQYDSIGSNAKFEFWARSLTSQYGLERFKVGLSTGGTQPSDFTIISGTNYIEPPVVWTLYSFNIPASYIGGNVRIAINCISNNAFALLIDDFMMDLYIVGNDDPLTPVIGTTLNGNYPNPFNPETSISYTVKGTSPVVVEIYNTKGQKVKTLVNETKATGNYRIKWNGTDEYNRKVSAGVYYYKMSTRDYSATKKMILMK